MPPARPQPSFWALHLGGWAAFALAMMAGRTGEWDLARTLAVEPAYAASAAAVSAVLRALYLRLGVDAARPVRATVVAVVASYVGGLVWTGVHNLYLRHVAPAALAAAYGGPVGPLQREFVLDGAVYQSALLLAWSALYVGARSYAALGAERERALRAEAQAHEARLRALRYQINPHFLFNALNGVSTLVTEGQARKATDMLAQLGDFLRLTLERDDDAEVPLAAEVDFVRRYLDIERARFGDRLRVRLDVAADVWDVPVPSLVLQPLVENAVKYAVAPREEGGEVAVEARSDGGALVLTVSDDGPGLPDGPGDGHDGGLGVGLANVRGRLLELYGEAGRMELGTSEAGGLRAALRLPIQRPARRPAPVSS